MQPTAQALQDSGAALTKISSWKHAAFKADLCQVRVEQVSGHKKLIEVTLKCFLKKEHKKLFYRNKISILEWPNSSVSKTDQMLTMQKLLDVESPKSLRRLEPTCSLLTGVLLRSGVHAVVQQTYSLPKADRPH